MILQLGYGYIPKYIYNRIYLYIGFLNLFALYAVHR